MMRRRTSSPDERGAVMVEFAMCIPVLFLLLFGIIEFGFSYRDSLTVSASTRSAARVVSNAGDDPDADYLALLQIEAALAELPDQSTLQKIIVFEPTNADGDIPAACETAAAVTNGGITGQCNVYSPAQMAVLDHTTYVNEGWAARFDPTTRETRQSVGTTWLGVQVVVDRDMVTDIIGIDSIELDHTAVFRIEPEVE